MDTDQSSNNSRSEPPKITIRLYNDEDVDRSGYRDKLKKIIKYKKKFDPKASVNRELLGLVDEYIEEWNNMGLIKSYKTRRTKTIEELEYLSKKSFRLGLIPMTILIVISIWMIEKYETYPFLMQIVVGIMSMTLLFSSMGILTLWSGFDDTVRYKKRLNRVVQLIKDDEDIESVQYKIHKNKNKLQVWLHHAPLKDLRRVIKRMWITITLIAFPSIFGVLYGLIINDISYFIFVTPILILIPFIMFTGRCEAHIIGRSNEISIRKLARETIDQ